MGEADNPTIDIRPGEGVDADRIDARMKEAVPDLRGEPRIRQYPSGASNLTYAVDYPDRAFVLRRPPHGAKPKSGHDMGREARVMSALKPVFGAVPEVIFYEPDESVLGAPFYIMEKIEGVLLRDRIPAEWGWGEDETRRLCLNFWNKLIELHKVDIDAAGLSDFGKPQGYVERQVLGWNARYEKAKTEDVDAFEDVRQWLADNRPAIESAHAVLHGDFRLDNAILDAADPRRIVALLDWEISALGDPLMDLGAALSYWVEDSDPPQMKALIKQPSFAPGMMSRREILRYYADRTDADISNFNFYYIFGVFRLAVIAQQIYYRYYHGQTKNSMFRDFGHVVQNLGQACRMLIANGAF